MAMPPPPTSMSHMSGLRPGGSPPDEKVSGFMVCMNVISTVTHLLLGAVVFFAFFVINTISGSHYPKVTAHVYLTVIGYAILMSQAIFSLNPQTGWANNFKYPRKTKIFWLLQVLGSLLAIIGGIMAIIAVGESYSVILPDGLVHLQFPHEIVGLVAMILTSVSFVGGVFHLFNKNMEHTKILKALQSCTVTLTLVIAFIAIGLAFDDRAGVIDIKSTNMALSLIFLTLLGMFKMMICKAVVKGRVVI